MQSDIIKEGIWRIPDGLPLELDNMTIMTNSTNKLLVTGWTQTIYFENISKDKVLEELKNLKLSFLNLLESYNDLKKIIKGLNLVIEYHMAYDDSGKGGIGLCSEIEGELNWYIM